jgi:hypothetical protein
MRIMAGSEVADEIESAIKQAAGSQTVVKIHLAVGKGVSVSKVELAKEMHARFPSASVELEEGRQSDAVVVKDIEVE